MELLSKGEKIELTAKQMRSYFKNLINHPKFDSINFSTKLFHYVVTDRIIKHKEEEGDDGAKTVGKNYCHQLLIFTNSPPLNNTMITSGNNASR